jgi:glyoxylase-like metal-dependent hydrolase (beta-lactamase superfamily II)
MSAIYSARMRNSGMLALLGILLGAGVAYGQQQDFSKVTIKTTKIADGIYMLEGQGGNIGLSVGEDGVVVIDDEFAPLTPKIQAAIAAITPKPIKMVLNTHWHFDHVGGNENFAATGAVIVAHDNVRKRMSTGQFMELVKQQVPPAPLRALPVITFSSDVTLHLNGEDIHVIHVDPAHTDGDSIVVFPKAKVVHMGDCFITVSYPFVDLGSGGNYDGFVSVADRVLGMVDDTFKIIPGHGTLSGKAELKSWRDMLAAVRTRVKKQVDAGKTLDAIQKQKLTTEWDDARGKGFIKPELVVEFAFEAIQAAKKAKH